jgi:hypothetical protein
MDAKDVGDPEKLPRWEWEENGPLTTAIEFATTAIEFATTAIEFALPSRKHW